jgi:hypothetical protein
VEKKRLKMEMMTKHLHLDRYVIGRFLPSLVLMKLEM